MTDLNRAAVAVNASAVVGVVFGVAAVLILGLAGGMRAIAIVPASAAIFFGVVASVKARQQNIATFWLGAFAGLLGLTVAAILVLT